MYISRRTLLSSLLSAIGAAWAFPGRGLGGTAPLARRMIDRMELEVLLASRPGKRPEATLRVEDDGGVLYLRHRGRETPVGHMNATACRVWDLCDGTRTLHEMADQVHRRYGVPLEEARADLAAFLIRMKRSGAIL